jgi:hypothetical protein
MFTQWFQVIVLIAINRLVGPLAQPDDLKSLCLQFLKQCKHYIHVRHVHVWHDNTIIQISCYSSTLFPSILPTSGEWICICLSYLNVLYRLERKYGYTLHSNCISHISFWPGGAALNIMRLIQQQPSLLVPSKLGYANIITLMVNIKLSM